MMNARNIVLFFQNILEEFDINKIANINYAIITTDAFESP